jgi:hypothetical protein
MTKNDKTTFDAVERYEQKYLAKDKVGTEGIKPAETPKSNDPLKQGRVGYVAFYKGKKYEVFGDDKLQARDKLAKALNVKKAYEINLEPAEVDGKEVKITPDF